MQNASERKMYPTVLECLELVAYCVLAIFDWLDRTPFRKLAVLLYCAALSTLACVAGAFSTSHWGWEMPAAICFGVGVWMVVYLLSSAGSTWPPGPLYCLYVKCGVWCESSDSLSAVISMFGVCIALWAHFWVKGTTELVLLAVVAFVVLPIASVVTVLPHNRT